MPGSTEGRFIASSGGDGERSHQRCWEGKGRSQPRTLGLGTQRYASVTAAPARPQLGGRPDFISSRGPTPTPFYI